MKKYIAQPAGLFPTKANSHVVTVTGGTTIHICGQVALDENWKIVGEGNFAAQVNKAFENVGFALKAAGAQFSDIVRMTVYIVNMGPEHREPLLQARQKYFQAPKNPAVTVIGVQALGVPGLMIEVEVTAVID
jgi:enamine deaminase RidA (YjgF/YER057c/UK114 family)